MPVVDTSRAETVLPKVHVVDRARLQTLISAAVGPTDAKGRPIPDAPNPHVMAPHNMQWQAWTIEFTKRLHPLLADELDAVSTAANAGHQHLAKQVNSNLTAFAKTMQKTLAAQQNWAQEVIAQAEMQRCVDQVRLDALWWSEALYSSSVRCGYRELPPLLAVMVMAVDLVTTVTAPAPTSVGYLLMEAVRRIGDHAPPLAAVLSALRDARNKLPTGWCDPLEAPPSSGHLCLRDLFVLAVGDREWSPEAALQRAGLAPDAVITLPQLAHAMFRQEQAVRLAARA